MSGTVSLFPHTVGRREKGTGYFYLVETVLPSSAVLNGPPAETA